MQDLEDNNDDLNENTAKTSKKTKESKTPMLDSFGRDMTQLAIEGKFDPVVGREVEMDRVIEVLGRRKKNNPVLAGEAGVGKTAIVEGIAQKIVNKETSRILFDKRIVSLDMSSLVAGTKYRGQFEERMKVLLEEVEATEDVIIFIDEIHTIIGAGNSAGALDVSNMLKPALARGTIQCIGATTLDEYKKSVERDNALERRFQKIIVEPSTPEETRIILANIKDRYEDYHNVEYSNEAIESCVKYSERYVSNRFFPDKAIDIMDTVGSRIHMDNINVPEEIVKLEEGLEKITKEKDEYVKQQNFEKAADCRDEEKLLQEKLDKEKETWHKECTQNRITITEEDIAKVVSRMIGVPVTKITADEGKKLVNMPTELKEQVIGQDEAVQKVSEAIQRSRANLQNPERPIGSFIFLGSTGVGKCITNDSKIKIRNKKTKIVEEVSIQEFYDICKK